MHIWHALKNKQYINKEMHVQNPRIMDVWYNLTGSDAKAFTCWLKCSSKANIKRSLRKMLILDEYFRWHLDAFASAPFISSSLASVWNELCLIRSVAWAPSSGRALNCPLKVLSDLVKDSLNQPLSHFGDVPRQIHLISTTVATKKTIIFPPLPLGWQRRGLYSSVDWINNRWNDTDICRTFCLAEHKHKPDTAI